LALHFVVRLFGDAVTPRLNEQSLGKRGSGQEVVHFQGYLLGLRCGAQGRGGKGSHGGYFEKTFFHGFVSS
jgi:hypothetical protein